jgi:hypothetical protein
MEKISCNTCKHCIDKKCIRLYGSPGKSWESCLFGSPGKSWDKSLYDKVHIEFCYNYWESRHEYDFFSEKEFIIEIWKQ